jgi:hypothetical protein
VTDHERLLAAFALIESDQHGEVLNAALAVRRLLKKDGKTVLEGLRDALQIAVRNDIDLQRMAQMAAEEFARGREVGRNEGKPARPASHQYFARSCLQHHADVLSQKEREFLRSFIDRGFPRPTQRQLETFFIAISQKVGVPLP